jgi:hypothetical protein
VSDQELLRRNIVFFSQTNSEIAKRIAAAGQPNGKLVTFGDGDFDLVRPSGPLYGQGAKSVAQAQITEHFRRESDNRIVLAPPQSDRGIDKHGAVFLFPLLQAAVESGIQFYSRRCDLRATMAISFGLGLGQHLPLLIERAECRTLIIVEPDFELFLFSLRTLDWSALFELGKRNSTSIHLVLTNDPLLAAIETLDIARYGNYAAFFDGLILFGHLQTSALLATYTAIMERCHTLGQCLGFIEDELLMLENTSRNLRGFTGGIFKCGTNLEIPPVFLVGSGPSLDETLPYLKRFADRAVIVSCGTALRVLIDNGVKPDIHVELENAPESYEALKVSVSGRDISDILLFASSTVDPRLKSHFSRAIFFFRRALAISNLFAPSPDYTLRDVSPNVSNLAMVFINELACRDVYLFGIDLGTKDPKHHHSVLSPYMKGELAWNWSYDIVLPGNFGENIYTEGGYVASKISKERAILYKGQGRNFFNLGHGLVIDGAAPLRPQDLDLPPLGVAKASVIEKLWQSCPQYSQLKSAASIDPDVLAEGIRSFVRELLAEISEIDDSYESVINGLLNISLLLHSEGGSEFSKKMMGGTIRMMFAAIYFYLVRTGTPEHRQSFARLTRQGLLSFLPQLGETVIAEINAMGLPANP